MYSSWNPLGSVAESDPADATGTWLSTHWKSSPDVPRRFAEERTVAAPSVSDDASAARGPNTGVAGALSVPGAVEATPDEASDVFAFGAPVSRLATEPPRGKYASGCMTITAIQSAQTAAPPRKTGRSRSAVKKPASHSTI